MIIAMALGLLALAGPQTAAADPLEGLRPYSVGIGVADVEASATWYGKALGFRVDRRMDLPGLGLTILFLRAGAFRLELVQKVGARPLQLRSCIVADPDGNLVQFMQERP